MIVDGSMAYPQVLNSLSKCFEPTLLEGRYFFLGGGGWHLTKKKSMTHQSVIESPLANLGSYKRRA